MPDPYSMAPRIAFVGPDDHAWLRRLRAGLGGGATLEGAEVVHAFAEAAAIRGLLLRARLRGIRAVVVTPLGSPSALPFAGRFVSRLLLPSQPEARAWAAWVPLGRIAVVEPEPAEHELAAILAVYEEVASMARRRRPD